MSAFNPNATANRKEANGEHQRGRVGGQRARNTGQGIGSVIAEEGMKVKDLGDKSGGDGHHGGAGGGREIGASTDPSDEEDEIAAEQIENASLEELEELERTLEDDYIPQRPAIVHASSEFTGISGSTAQAYPPGLGISFDANPNSPHDTDEESDGAEDDADNDFDTEIAYVTRGEEQLYRVHPYKKYRVRKYSRLRICWKPIRT
jgi:hypothetical protein